MANKKGTEVWRGQVRMPAPIMAWVHKRAEENFRSANAELVELVRDAMRRDSGRVSTEGSHDAQQAQ
ncbi:Arc family DNA-binding protein [Massilia sp. TS11]|uniref:Arc family DNA-binding protein n=1 Tax=Massilia sp. TS11 TaxID=2908003 RepID=UPI001EDC02CF|nr:Arc family DNA-binding protein [Massilia sp. TS11]MCG2586487.1 Arc family DNA-binding protein [Massilia sp. TS11]